MPWADALGVGVANKRPERAKEASQSRCVPKARYPINPTLSASIVWGLSRPHGHACQRHATTIAQHVLVACIRHAGEGCIQIPHTTPAACVGLLKSHLSEVQECCAAGSPPHQPPAGTVLCMVAPLRGAGYGACVAPHQPPAGTVLCKVAPLRGAGHACRRHATTLRTDACRRHAILLTPH